MSNLPIDPEELFATIVDEFLGNPDVISPLTEPQKKGFGSSTLRVHQKIFAMLVKGQLVVKLPSARVDALVSSGTGQRFDPRHDGRFMKEWVSIQPVSEELWLSLAKEAMKFVASRG